MDDDLAIAPVLAKAVGRKQYPPITIKWTHVADGLPDRDDQWPKVLLIVQHGVILPATYSGKRWTTVSEQSAKPTHWARIPLTPYGDDPR